MAALVKAQFGKVGNYALQPVLLKFVRVYLSEPGLSETVSGTMSKLHLSEPHLSEPHSLELELSENIPEHTVIVGIVRDYVRVSLVRATFIRK